MHPVDSIIAPDVGDVFEICSPQLPLDGTPASYHGLSMSIDLAEQRKRMGTGIWKNEPMVPISSSWQISYGVHSLHHTYQILGMKF